MDPAKSELLVPTETSNKERQGRKVRYYHMMMDGVGVLLSWNAICTGFDWINGKYSGLGINVSFVLTVINFFPNLILQPLTIKYGHLFSFNKRIIISYIAMGCLLAITPIVVNYSGEDTGFGLMCIIVLAIGGFNAISQTSVFALGATMPNEYTNAVMAGNGVAGVLINVLRVICLAALPSDLLLSVIIYFAVSGVVLVFCIISQWLLLRDPFVIECVRKTLSKVDTYEGEAAENELRTVDGASLMEDNPVGHPPPSFMQVWAQIWPYASLVFTCYVITFGMYPTVCVSTTGKGLHYEWFSVLMLLVFNVCDWIGRNAPALFIAKGKLLCALVFGRFIFWVTFLLIASSQPPTWLFGKDAAWFKFINMGLFAFSNGYTSTCCMIMGPSLVQPAWKDRAGSIMSTALVWGIFTGSLLALSFTTVAHPPSD